jgi:polynucleotide 5'-kinase involved in rRNA processing
MLDPADAHFGPAARLVWAEHDKPKGWRFYGSLDPLRSPHVMAATAAEFAHQAGPTTIFVLFPYRPSPLLRQLAHLIAQILQPEEILVAQGTEIDLNGWPVGPTEVETEEAFPEMVQSAQRKAQWLRLVEQCSEHRVDLRSVPVEGARLGAGRILSSGEMKKSGLADAEHAEVCGGNLFLVSETAISEETLARALDLTHCSRATITDPKVYQNVLCSFVRQNGEDFGMGFVREIDFRNRTAKVFCSAVPNAPVRILRLGSLRLDENGREGPEVRPWQL